MTTPYHRTNINLLASDVEFLITRYGNGWTVRAREIIHDYVRTKQRAIDICLHCAGTGQVTITTANTIAQKTCPLCHGTGYHNA